MANCDNRRVLVAVGIILNAQNQVLMAQRQAHQHQAFRWEFPGGKVEPNESVEQALRRELLEEVGITIHQSIPFMEAPFDYPDKHVHLSCHKVHNFDGTPIGLEDQKIEWVNLNDLKDYPVPLANQQIVDALIA